MSMTAPLPRTALQTKIVEMMARWYGIFAFRVDGEPCVSNEGT
jgi:hypothetical protein